MLFRALGLDEERIAAASRARAEASPPADAAAPAPPLAGRSVTIRASARLPGGVAATRRAIVLLTGDPARPIRVFRWGPGLDLRALLPRLAAGW